MKHLKRWNESVNQDDIDNIKEILQSWMDDFDFDFMKHTDTDHWDGIFYHISVDRDEVEITFNINKMDKHENVYNEIKDRMGELVLNLRGNYNFAICNDFSKLVSWDQRELVVTIKV